MSLGTLTAGAVALAHDGVGDHRTPPPDALAVTTFVRVGEGEHTYENVPNWCKLPSGTDAIGASTHGGLVEDKDGNIYFTMEAGPHAIYVYKPDGTMARAIDDPKLLGIHGLCINDENGEQFIYGAHLAGARAVKLKLDGTLVWEIPFEKFNESGKYKDKGQFHPTAIAVAPDGSIFVADGYGQNWVHKFDKDQKYLMSFGGPSKNAEEGKFATCHGLGIDKRGEKPLLLVCDRANRRLQEFDFDGKFVKVIAQGLRLPCAPSFHGDHIAIAELEGRVTILDKDNKEVAHLGDNPNTKQWATNKVDPKDWKPGVFTAPHGMTYDHAGNLYVMDWNVSGRVSKFVQVGDAEKKAQALAPVKGAAPVAAR
jgi:DNA-binding beta-propeller fold protein YncE